MTSYTAYTLKLKLKGLIALFLKVGYKFFWVFFLIRYFYLINSLLVFFFRGEKIFYTEYTILIYVLHVREVLVSESRAQET